MPESIEQKAAELKKSMEAAQAEAKAANEKAEAAEKKAAAAEKKADEAMEELKKSQTTIEEQKSSIENLDKSVKEQEATIKELKSKSVRPGENAYEVALKGALDANREEMERMFKAERGTSDRLKFKFTTTNITTQSFGVQQDPVVHSDRMLANAFYDTFQKVTRTADKMEWLEGSDTDNTGYVGEFSAPSTANSYTVAGKLRQYAKIASFIEVSSEVADWYNQIYEWARTTAVRRILQKVDSLIWSGDGNDSTQKTHIYGIKTQGNTAYAASGAKYANATVADVILDAIAQAKKNGYVANVCLIPYAMDAQIRGLKDANGNYLYNQVTGMLGQVRIIPTTQLGNNELVVADSACVQIYENGEYEMELERVAGKDGWNVYLRKSFQVRVTGPDKKGVIYVSNITTAIEGLAPAAAAAASVSGK